MLWTVETVLHKYVTDETLLLDQVLFIEIFEIWNYLLTSQGLRPLFMAEKEKNPGIPEHHSPRTSSRTSLSWMSRICAGLGVHGR